MWELYEAYDPVLFILYLDLISKPAVVPEHPGLAKPQLLETFKEINEARQFADCYLKALSYKKDKVVREVRCGSYRRGGCSGPGKPCYLGLDDYHCKAREGK